ncbi:30S ribosomal protein S7 [Candidatus Dojkabacteria bacterium]|uniref:Small ribosomal subunit protein uS7 n=1 Tax=Candidatus Dojkabacteria bacterium TaxID=2099670 RepID=A0A955HXP0_9BACT|nr:30S ribosomal protein S7 [Candidatus Dojkabacteria bacterium]MCB9790881.1 30S ribosomal protein S7 [Candidatus Nomurabacteria bacterium]
MRGKRAKKKNVLKDHKYESELVTRFISKVMLHGQKKKAEGIFYTVLETASKEVGLEAMDFLNQVVDNLRPSLEVKARRVGGANYHIPLPVTPHRQETLAIRWLIDSARKKSGSSFTDILKKEMLETYNGSGDAMKKKEETERMAEANKAFAHFRW